MRLKVENIIENEDKYKPLTDQEIAELLNTTRDRVTQLRKELNIPNSRERLDLVIFTYAKDIIHKEPSISHRELMSRLNSIGFSISRHKSLALIKEISHKNHSMDPGNSKEKPLINRESQPKTEEVEGKSFREIIGAEESIKLQIRQAQAAILYPPKGLHTLILGPSGVGKSQLAESMHSYAVTTSNFEEKAPFILFNCADYADNPQLLLSNIFGYKKGTFTGADSDQDGLVAKADGGILFLDEIHRLPNEGQEILFSILDKGEYRRLGETESNHKVNLMIIAATTEDPDSSLLLTLRRRIPMIIELPSLNKRTYSERLEIIKVFFDKEAKRINKKITVDIDAIRLLMLYDCPGNIGQLKSDIQVACAKALLNAVLEKKETLKIKISDLASHVRRGILNIDRKSQEIESYISNHLVFDVDHSKHSLDESNRYIMPNKIYQFIEKRSIELENQGLNSEEINLVIGREVQTELENFVKNSNIKNTLNKIELKNLVGSKILELVDQCYKLAKVYYDKLEDDFYYSLAIHLSATYERILKGKEIINPELRKIKSKYHGEYEVAKKIAEKINGELMIQLPEEEIGFIAMYIKNFSEAYDADQKRVGVIVLTHGKVGKAIVEVTNTLLNTQHAIGIEMPLSENPKDTLAKTIDIIKKVDQGKGCLLLVDMGSLVTFGDIITRETGIYVRVVERVDTIMALEVTRRAILPQSTLEDIVKSIKNDGIPNKEIDTNKAINANTLLPKAIVTTCITGEGTAEKIKDYIEEYAEKSEKNIKVIPVGLFSPINLDLEIKKISQNYHILCFVGTIDPEIKDIPFISIQSILSNQGINQLNNLITNSTKKDVENNVGKILDEKLIECNLEFENKNQAIDYMVDKLVHQGYVDEKFLLSVYKREMINSTSMKGDIAIPHGLPQYVKKPIVNIITLKKPISWGEGKTVDAIFMIVYRKDSKKYFQDFYKVLLNGEVLKKIKQTDSEAEIKNIILRHVDV